MEETPSVDIQGDTRVDTVRPPRRRLPLANILSFAVGLVGVAAIGASAWTYTETQREVIRLSTDIAQLRLSLDLYSQRQGAAPAAATDTAGLQDLSNRLSVLEENWRNAPASAATVLPATPAAAAPTTAAASGDCLPTGTRFMVAAGDNYPVCGQGVSVEIGAVDNGFISLADGTVVAAGGTIAMPGSACMLGVVSAGADGMTDFAEIRVSC
ncbi:hypothetical protein SAMN05428969_2643 [Devosia sp. YR412]|nr:hypothetical protein SAMN05428969_2643 [Devosia sp. YR412]